MYDVIIAGASFAGLAVANQLKDYRVLILDRKPVGTGQTSACGTILRLLEYWGLEESLLQAHKGLKVHTRERDVWFPSPYPWCTFDYAAFCGLLFKRSGAEFLQAVVKGVKGDQVLTTGGSFSAHYIVDATGWKATLASSRMDSARDSRRAMNLGVESIVELSVGENYDREALHFWFDSTILQRGLGWAFPRGKEISVGVGSYGHKGKMLLGLERLTTRLGTTFNGVHGTYFPYKLHSPVAENLFVVGDAAGMCIALSGEGIRPAMFFGEACGQIIRRCLDDGLLPADGLKEYAEFVQSHRGFFNVFSAAQWLITRLPTRAVDIIAENLSKPRIRSWLFDAYWGLTQSWDEVPIHPAG